MWPNFTVELGPITDSDEEDKRIIQSYSIHVKTTEGMTQLFFSKFSNWKKLQKAVAWMLRYKEWMTKTFLNDTQTAFR